MCSKLTSSDDDYLQEEESSLCKLFYTQATGLVEESIAFFLFFLFSNQLYRNHNNIRSIDLIRIRGTYTYIYIYIYIYVLLLN